MSSVTPKKTANQGNSSFCQGEQIKEVATCMEEVRNAYKTSVGKPEDLDEDRTITLKMILKIQAGRV